MPRKAPLLQEEKMIIDAMMIRQSRWLKLAESHAAVVRAMGTETLRKAYDEASKALAPKTGKEVMFPARGTNMDEYYKQFDHILDAKASTPYEHIYIALVATGLLTVMMSCEYAVLSYAGQTEVDRRSRLLTLEQYPPKKGSATTKTPSRFATVPNQALPDLPPIEPSANLKKLQPAQISDYLREFSRLHLKILYDNDSNECFKIISANFSATRPEIESYEVQFEGCPSAVTIPYNDVKEMLERSSCVA